MTLFQLAQDIIEQNQDLGHPDLIQVLENYAALLRELKRVDKAIVFEERVSGMRAKLEVTSSL